MYNRLILFFLLIYSFQSYSQKLLKNIASADASSYINQSFTDFNNYLVKGDTLFFLAQDTSYSYYHGKNIWFTNGTTANTKKVTSGDYIYQTFGLLASFKGKAYFSNNSNSNLYATDGNATIVVKSFNNSAIQKASVIGEWLYLFVSNNSANVLELWRTDGTNANTSKVTDIYNGSHYLNGSDFLNTGDKIYFNLYTASYGYEPWITDGTTLGTKILKDLRVGSESGNSILFEKANNTVFFYARDENDLLKLWKTDGTETGTVVVAETIDGNQYYYPSSKISYDNQLYFIANENKFYKTDGNTVTLVRDNLSIVANSLALTDIVKMNNLMYFIRRNGSEFELWKSDGSTAGTEKVKAILSTSDYYYMTVRILAGASKIYFQMGTFKNSVFENTTQHWMSDGTTAGTININTLNPNFSTGSYNNQLAVIGDTYYFTAFDAVNGFELWRTNGTSIGTLMVKNINKSITSSDPAQFIALDNDVYFSADDVKYGREIWKSDGTPVNTRLLMDLNASSDSDINYSAYISGMTTYNDIIIAQIGNQLVKFNQTLPPTPFFMTSHVNPENPEFTKFNNKIFYKGWDNDNNINGGGYELFATDGNITTKVKDFTINREGGHPTNLIVSGGLLYFTTENNTKIWKSDGTEAGTVLVKTFATGSVQSKFYATNGLLMFTYQDPAYGLELWKTDGTEVGTEIVKDINPGTGGAHIGNFGNLVVFNNNLFFVAYDGIKNRLYKSDGSGANTQPLGDINIMFAPIVFKNKLFFITYDYYGAPYWLWSTDGISTPVKVKQLADMMQNASATVSINVENNLLVFDVVPNYSRHELWASDGTASGTKLIKLIRNKETSIYGPTVSGYFFHNSKLYFAADDGINGKELWVWDFNCPEFMTITNTITQNTDFMTDKYIIGSNKINVGIKVSYNANKYITLIPGFETQSGSRFTANIDGCLNLSAPPNATNGEPVFKNLTVKGETRPSIIQFLSNPLNNELLAAYLLVKKNHNEQNIAWIIDESSAKYILKMRVGDKEWIGYLPK